MIDARYSEELVMLDGKPIWQVVCTSNARSAWGRAFVSCEAANDQPLVWTIVGRREAWDVMNHFADSHPEGQQQVWN